MLLSRDKLVGPITPDQLGFAPWLHWLDQCFTWRSGGRSASPLSFGSARWVPLARRASLALGLMAEASLLQHMQSPACSLGNQASSRRKASLSGAKRRAEESAQEAELAMAAKGSALAEE